MIIEKRWCTHCHSKYRLVRYRRYKKKNGDETQYFSCNKCNTQRQNKYYRTKIGNINIKKAVKKYSLINTKRKNAWSTAKVYNPKNLPCSICGESPSHRHHPNIDNPKEIVYLCPYHHKQKEKML